MKTAVIRHLYEKTNKGSFSEQLESIHDRLPGHRKGSVWRQEIKDLLYTIDWTDPLFIDEVAADVEQAEKKRRNVTAPGNGAQIQLDLCTKDWAQKSIIILPEDESIRAIDAMPEHWMIGLEQRQKKALEANEAVQRFMALVKMAYQAGVLPAEMRWLGIIGW